MGTEVTFEEIESRTRALMPEVTEQLKNLIRYLFGGLSRRSPKTRHRYGGCNGCALRASG